MCTHTDTPEQALGIVAAQLRQNFHNIPAKDHSFVNSLLKAHNRMGVKISGKQEHWLRKFHHIALHPECNKPKEVDVGIDLTPIIDLLKTAETNLKYPKLRFDLEGDKIVLTRSKGGKYPGTVQITSPGGYGNNTWYGRINLNGTFTPSKAADDLPELDMFLQSFAKNPQAAALSYGQKTCQCCFCGTKLTTKESRTAGYGPICAENWGLPWGHTP